LPSAAEGDDEFLAATALALMALTTTAHGQMLMTTRYLALPPAEYDYPYQGQLTLARADARTMSAVCPKTAFPVTLGCAINYRELNICHIFIAEDEILRAAGWSYKIVFRHERAHCQNWPANHPGMREPIAAHW
jgi:hypothetical protein